LRSNKLEIKLKPSIKILPLPKQKRYRKLMGKWRGKMIPQIKKILDATDLSKNSSYAFLYATDTARRHDAKIAIIHVIEPIPRYAEVYAGVTDEMKRKQQEEAAEELTKHLKEFYKKAEAQIGPPCVELVSKILVPIGHPPEEILNIADKESCNVIIVGSDGKGFLAHTFLGSVSNAALHRRKKPVFIIPFPLEKTTFDWNGI
jgi:nucleotide-binding universal stress UspA family protein